MSVETYIIDPDADTVLVLSPTIIVFACWDDARTELAAQHQSGEDASLYNPIPKDEYYGGSGSMNRKKKKKKATFHTELPRPSPPSPPPEPEPVPEPAIKPEPLDQDDWTPTDDPVRSEDPPAAVDEPPVVETTATSEDSGEEAVVLDEPQEDEEDGIKYMVSSRHLALASVIFKIKLTEQGWKEGVPDKSNGRYRLQTSDWDPEALLILMNILHLRNRHVPRAVGLDMFAKIAALVDYYECAEAVEMVSERWLVSTKLTSPVPKAYERSLILWICIAWVFKLPREFQDATKIAITQNTTPKIQHMELPIPKVVLASMEKKRCQLLEELVQGLQDWLNMFRGKGYSCPHGTEYSFVCSSVLVGGLSKVMDDIKCLYPRPEVPFPGLGFEKVCSLIERMMTPQWSPYRALEIHPCGFSDTVQLTVGTIQKKFQGLDLHDFYDKAGA